MSSPLPCMCCEGLVRSVFFSCVVIFMPTAWTFRSGIRQHRISLEVRDNLATIDGSFQSNAYMPRGMRRTSAYRRHSRVSRVCRELRGEVGMGLLPLPDPRANSIRSTRPFAFDCKQGSMSGHLRELDHRNTAHLNTVLKLETGLRRETFRGRFREWQTIFLLYHGCVDPFEACPTFSLCPECGHRKWARERGY